MHFTSSGLSVCFDVYPRFLIYAFILVPVLLGVPLRPQNLYPALPYIYSFSWNGIHRGFLYNYFNYMNIKVSSDRFKVNFKITSEVP